MSRMMRAVGGLPGMSPWWRCDLCRWSGQPRQFVSLRKGEDTTDICLHSWCYGNAFVREQMLIDGWWETFNGRLAQP